MNIDIQADIRKSQILKDAGYRYNLERELYVNRAIRTAFSIDFLEETDEQEIRRRLSLPPPVDGWVFHFVKHPSDAVRIELERLLSNGRAKS
jgi:hypothetical protein